jgi:Holliday junction DNA helicase RuvA
MIASLNGVLAEKSPPRIVLEVAGIGYDVEVPMSTFYGLPATGAPLRLLIHQVVREDALLLYGLASDGERSVFRHLLKVSGVGPRFALAILSGISIESFAQLVHAEDVAALTRIPGVGRKTAERLLIEMRDKLALPQSPAASADNDWDAAQAEALTALLALGYKPPEASRLIKLVDAQAQTTEEIIRGALQYAGRN